MKIRVIALLLALSFAAGSAGTAAAHSGGTNDQGCHKNHKTGDYHCH